MADAREKQNRWLRILPWAGITFCLAGFAWILLQVSDLTSLLFAFAAMAVCGLCFLRLCRRPGGRNAHRERTAWRTTRPMLGVMIVFAIARYAVLVTIQATPAGWPMLAAYIGFFVAIMALSCLGAFSVVLLVRGPLVWQEPLEEHEEKPPKEVPPQVGKRRVRDCLLFWGISLFFAWHLSQESLLLGLGVLALVAVVSVAAFVLHRPEKQRKDQRGILARWSRPLAVLFFLLSVIMLIGVREKMASTQGPSLWDGLLWAVLAPLAAYYAASQAKELWRQRRSRQVC